MNNFQEKLSDFLNKYNEISAGNIIGSDETVNKSVFVTKFRTDFQTLFFLLENPTNFDVETLLNSFQKSWSEAAPRLVGHPYWFREMQLFLASLVFVEVSGVLQTDMQKQILNYLNYLTNRTLLEPFAGLGEYDSVLNYTEWLALPEKSYE